MTGNERAVSAVIEYAEKSSKKCPRCGRRNLFVQRVFNAVSRLDSTTLICAPCGGGEVTQAGLHDRKWYNKRAWRKAKANAVAYRLEHGT